MQSLSRVAVTGTGYAVPAGIRDNDDPIFDWLKKHNPAGTKLFQGYQYRRVLAAGETLMDIMVPAALRALDDANLAAKQIDVLIGYASVSEYETPNALAHLHGELNLRSDAWVMPLNHEFGTFIESLILADALIKAGRAKHILIVCGCNWTRYVDYHTPQSVSASDGAGAAVVGLTDDVTRFSLVDMTASLDTSNYGVMFMKADKINSGDAADAEADHFTKARYTKPYFHITEAGQIAFSAFGLSVPVTAAELLLQRNNLTSAQISLITHQASSVLIDAWQTAINPAQYLQTLQPFANMTLASVPVTLADLYSQIANDYLLMFGLGADLNVSAVLLRRSG